MSALPPIATAKADIRWQVGEASVQGTRDRVRRHTAASSTMRG